MSSSPIDFGNPRALYDPHYLPPKLLHRNKELRSLMTLYQSSLQPDELYNINTYIYGIRGVGKTVFTRYLIDLLNSENGGKFITLYLDFAVKTPDENLRLLVERYSQVISKKFTYLNDSKQLWSYFQFLRNKSKLPLILVFDNIDYYNQDLYSKILRFSKTLKISTIATSQIPVLVPKQKSKELTNQLDIPFKLDVYSSSELLDIVSQRIALAFPINLNPPLHRYLVDIVTEFDLYRPSTCIEALRTIYHHILNGDDVNPTLVRDISIPLVEFPYHDDLECFLEFDDSPIDLIYLPLLEKLAYYFRKKENVYITKSQLFQFYQLTCDEMAQPYNMNQFNIFLEQLTFKGFLYQSKFKSEGENLFFMIIHPIQILEYLEIKCSSDFH